MTKEQKYNREYYLKNKDKLLNNQKKYRKENPDKVRATNRLYRQNNREVVRQAQLKHTLNSVYGITIEEHNELYHKQEGRCAICGKHQSECNKRLAIDHDHNTGEVRGLLCSHCNQGLGHFKDNTELLVNAIQYLQKFEGK